MRKPEIGLVGHSAAVLRRLTEHLAHIAAAAGTRGAKPSRSRNALPPRWPPRWRRSSAYLRAIRDVLPDDGVLIDELTQVGYAARSGYETRKAAHLHLVGLSGHARLGHRHRARRQARARRHAGGGAERRRRLHVQRAGTGDGGAPPHPDRHGLVQRQRLRQRAQHAEEPARQPRHRQRPRQSGLHASSPTASASAAIA